MGNDTWQAADTEILRVIVGSTLHGLKLEGQDDRDEMGITIEPAEYVIGLKHFEQDVYRSAVERMEPAELTAGGDPRSGPGDTDRTIYSLRKWAKLAAQGNPTVLLPLFAPRAMILKGDASAAYLRHSRAIFLSRDAGWRFRGYLNQQREKLLGQRSGAPKRPELIERYGYDTKFAMHMIRLAYQGIELMETGRITLPMPSVQREVCMAVRQGKVPEDGALFTVGELEKDLVAAIENSELPERPDYDAINKLLMTLYQDSWDRRKRFGEPHIDHLS